MIDILKISVAMILVSLLIANAFAALIILPVIAFELIFQ